MRHLIASLALVSAPLAIPSASQDLDPPEARNHLRHEPSLTLEFRGEFGLCQIVVNNDGSWSCGDVTRDGSSFRAGSADPQALRELMGSLEELGAVHMLDQVGGHHVTTAWTLCLLYGETDAAAHTLTWWAGESPEHVLLQGRVTEYLADELGILLPN